MKLSSANEWDRLTAAVVGTVSGFSPGLETRAKGATLLARAERIAMKAYPQSYLDEVAEDLAGICDVLRRAGVTVFRPQWTEETHRFSTPNWIASGHDVYNVRDLHTVVGNTLITASPPFRYRLFDHYALQDIFYRNFFREGVRWVAPPAPKMRGEFIHDVVEPVKPPADTLAGDATPEQLWIGTDKPGAPGVLTEEHHLELDDEEVLFGGSAVVRLGRDILVLVSTTANRKASEWLSDVLGPDHRVHVTHSYRSDNLGSTIVPLAEGLVLLNGAHVTSATCPGVLRSWDKIYVRELAPAPDDELRFHRDVRLAAAEELAAIDVSSSSLSRFGTDELGMSVLSINPTTVMVHDRQAALMRQLEARGMTVIPVRLRHPYTMLGGLRRVTLDVVRAAP